jgi:hypothetical protein
MSGWALFLLIVFVLGIVISSIMLLKYNAKMKLHENVMRIIENKKIEASLAKAGESKEDKKTNIK